MQAELPDFFLGSSEQRDEWAEARACRIRGQLDGPHGAEYVWIQIDPPVIGQPYGLESEDIRDLLISPHYEGSSLVSPINYPVPVYVYRVLNTDILANLTFQAEDVALVAWGEIYETKEAAKRADWPASANNRGSDTSAS